MVEENKLYASTSLWDRKQKKPKFCSDCLVDCALVDVINACSDDSLTIVKCDKKKVRK
jgi:hypothetical protein